MSVIDYFCLHNMSSIIIFYLVLCTRSACRLQYPERTSIGQIQNVQSDKDMAHPTIIESSGNTQNVLLLLLSFLFVNDILNHHADENDYSEDYEEDNEDDHEDASATDQNKPATSVWLYVLIPLWATSIVLNWMLFYDILQDPAVKSTNGPLSMFIGKPISYIDLEILWLILLNKLAMIIYTEHSLAPSYIKAAMARWKFKALFVFGLMFLMALLICVFVLAMINHHKTIIEVKIISVLLIVTTIMTYIMGKITKMT